MPSLLPPKAYCWTILPIVGWSPPVYADIGSRVSKSPSSGENSLWQRSLLPLWLSVGVLDHSAALLVHYVRKAMT